VAAAGFATAATPSLAQQVEELTVYGAYSVRGEPQRLSAVVSYRDLDLTTQMGQEELRRRISNTADELCEKLGEPRGSVHGSAVKSCRDEAVQRASGDMRIAVANAVPRGPGWTPEPALAAAPPPPEPAPAANTFAEPAAAEAPTTRLVTNGAVPDTPENRARFGGPMSNAGKRTAPAGN
jgi:UrcA family protein